MKGNKALVGGVSFGLTSAVITTIGVMVGLAAGTESKMVVIGGILTVAIADSFSDALAMHLSEESSIKRPEKYYIESAIATFLSKFFFTIAFIIPVLLFEIDKSVIVSIIIGFIMLGFLSYYAAKRQKIPALKVMIEHWAVAAVVVVLTHFGGRFIEKIFSGYRV